MATNQLSRVIQTLRIAALPYEGAGLSDGQLLECYVSSREEAAFAALVHRHGPMVWGVCRRVLQGYQDAEDAFQATFLVLVRKAAGVVPREMVANWLYGVAHQTARKARATTAKRRGREKQVTAMPEPALEQQQLDDLQPLLDQELSRLPDKYRAVIVLCDLGGKTRKEAARHFHLPEGTVATRLATARAMLARRLARSGLAVSGAALAGALAPNTASASVPISVASTTIKAASLFAAGQTAAPGVISAKAALLAEGVLRTMLLTKLKIATAVLMTFAILATSAAALTHQGVPEKPAELASQERKRLEENPRPEAKPHLEARKEPEPIPTLVSGVVKAVNVDQNALTVVHREGEATFNVAKDANINIDGKPGALAGLPAGASVHLRQFVDPKTTASIQAEGRWFWGTVKTIDDANSTITYGDKAQDGAAGKTFLVPKDMVVSVDRKSAKLADIPAGASANLQLYADQTTVRSLSVEGAQIDGIAKAVDAANKTITLNETTYPVAADAQVAIDFKPGLLEGVPVGANVTLNLRVDQKTVLHISAGGSSVFGAVKAVNIRTNSITVSDRSGDRTFNVAADTHIVIDGKPGTLAGIPAGAGLHALNLRVDQQTAHSINVVGPGYHHVPVKAVDAEKNTITIDDQAPPEVAGKTLLVAAAANIEIDGKPGRLTAVPAGSFVSLGLTVDGQTALNLQAEGPNLGDCGGSPVTAVDAANNTITFADKGASAVAGKTFSVAKDAWILIDGKPGKLSELPTGSYVNVTLTVDHQAVRSLGAQGPRVAGVVKAVDLDKNALTVDDTTYPLAKDALVVIDGTQRPLADLSVGANVNLNLHVDHRTVGMIQTKAP